MSLSEARKATIALAVAGISIAAYFVTFDPSFQQAATVVIGQVFAVIGVFAATNHTQADANKAITALAGGSLSLVGLFVTVDPSTTETILGVLSQVLLVAGVFAASNEPDIA